MPETLLVHIYFKTENEANVTANEMQQKIRHFSTPLC